MNHVVDRRRFLKYGGSAAVALYGAPLDLVTGSHKPLQPKGPAKKVIVVGAGLAGLSAAYELTQAGHDVTILEAQMRPGGRVLTLRESFSDSLYAEAGAARFADTHDLTLQYVELFGLTLDPFYPSEQTARQYSTQYFRGRRITIEPGEEVDLLSRAPVELQPEVKQLGYSGLWERLTPPELQELGDPGTPGWPPDSLRQYDQMTIAEFLREQGASPATIAALMFWEVDPEDDPRSPLADYATSAFGPNQGAKDWFKIRGGTDLLPKAFAARLVDTIHYGAAVVRIEQDAGNVSATFLQAGRHHRIAGDYLICAIPYSVLRHVEISPPFTPEKQRAIEEQLYDSHARVFLQSRKRYWLEEGFDGFADTDVLGEIWHPTFDQPGPRGVLVSSLIGTRAQHVAGMTETQRVSYALEQMETIFPGMRQHFEGGSSKAWDEDPWARGAFAYFKAGQLTWILPHLAKPEGRVHFAGTHTSPWRFGWMQGALESGARTAREINEAS